MNPIIRQILLGKQQGLENLGLVDYWDFVQGANSQLLYGKHAGINLQLGSAAGADSSDPTWINGGLQFVDDYVKSTSNIFSSTPQGLTSIIVFKRTVGGTYSTIFSTQGNGYNGQYIIDTEATANIIAGGYVGSGGNAVSGTCSEIVVPVANEEVCMISQTITPAVMSVYKNKALSNTRAGTYDLSTLGQTWIGGGSRSVTAMTAYFAMLYDKELSLAEIELNYNYLKRMLSQRGVVLP